MQRIAKNWILLTAGLSPTQDLVRSSYQIERYNWTTRSWQALAYSKKVAHLRADSNADANAAGVGSGPSP